MNPSSNLTNKLKNPERQIDMRTSSLEMFNRYLQLQAAIKEKATQPQQPSITISRESGAGASTVAQMVVEHLNAIKTLTGNTVLWTVFDKNLAKEVIVDHKLPLELEDEARSSYLRRYFNADSDNPFFYHLILNTAKTGFAEAAELIVQSALRHHQAFLQSQQSLRAA
jgi:cytidylate kinase